jgi:hypothetical protein
MAQGDGAIFNTFKELVMEGTYNLSTGNDVVKVILCGTYTPDIDGDTVYGDVSGSEYNAGSGYPSGGAVVTGTDVTVDNGNDRGGTAPNGGDWTLQWGANGVILLT